MSTNAKLIILPGWEQCKLHWQTILDKLKGEFDAQVVELPGFGEEKLVSTDWGIPHYSAWLKEKIENEILLESNCSTTQKNNIQSSFLNKKNKAAQLNTFFLEREGESEVSKTSVNQKIILLGHSFGGRISNYLSAKYKPDWLAGQILYAAPLIYRPNSNIKIQIAISKLIKNFAPIDIIPKKWRGHFYSDDLRASLTSGKEDIFRRVVGFDQTKILEQNKTRTVLLWGEFDQSAPLKLAVEINQKLPNSELIVLNGFGHNIHLENPNLFYGKLKHILQNNF